MTTCISYQELKKKTGTAQTYFADSRSGSILLTTCI